LNPAVARQKIALTRQLPAEALRGLVEHYWIVRWDLRGEAPHTQETLPHPSVHWVTGEGRSYVIGVVTGRFARVLEGRGRAVGVKFKPGGFYPFWRARIGKRTATPTRTAAGSVVSALTDAEITAEEAFGADGAKVACELLEVDAAWRDAVVSDASQEDADVTHADGKHAKGEHANGARVDSEHADHERAKDRQASNEHAFDARANDERMMSLVDRFLLARLPAPDAQVDAISAIVDRIMSDRDIIKVDDVAARFDINKRTLQRLFNQYVGVNPKWVIKRYRLHEAVERVAAGEVVNWSQLAMDLGYFDQTHFIKDFKALIGKSPAEYARGADGRAAR
jgi:AraC-like DNA-binding protein